MPPPPVSENANRWYSPLGDGILGLKVQPNIAAHHVFVATGSSLASSVCVIQPYSPGVGTCAGAADVAVLVARFLGILHRGDLPALPSSAASDAHLRDLPRCCQ